MRQLLVLYPGALGDLLLAAPIFFALSQRKPAASVHLVGSFPQARILQHLHLVHKTSSLDDAYFLPLFSNSPLPVDFKRWLSQFDQILVCVNGNLHPPLGQLAHTFCCSPRPTQHPSMHHAQFLYNTVREFLHLPARDVTKFALKSGPSQTNHPRLLVHPGSGSPKKNVSLDYLTGLIDRWVQHFGGQVIVLIGPAEQKMAKSFNAWRSRRNFNLIISPSWPTLLRTIDSSNFYLGNDSGISHLVGLFDKSGLVFFRRTDPKIWRPLGRNLLAVKIN